jgi:hypothetical protein
MRVKVFTKVFGAAVLSLVLSGLVPQSLNAQTQAEIKYNRGLAHYTGNGLPYSHYRATQCFKEACELGSQNACKAYKDLVSCERSIDCKINIGWIGYQTNDPLKCN